MKINLFKNNKLIEVFHKFSWNYGDIVEFARDIFSSSEKLKKIVLEENQALQKSSVALDEIASMLERTADSAKKLNTMSNEANDSVHKGQQALTNVVKGLDKINNSTAQLSDTIEDKLNKLETVVKSLGEIKAKTNLINDIVFQTRLLSFNASVEAARAGEHGRGFAVVADEMVKLAGTSGSASNEINLILQKNLSSTAEIIDQMKKEIIELMNKAKKDVDEGSNYGKDCANAFEIVSNKVSSVSSFVKDITSATSEQSVGVREITQSIHDLQNTSGNLSTLSEETLKISIQLSEQMENQTKLISAVAQEMGTVAKMKTKPFDFKSAVSAHQDWKMKLIRYQNNPDGSLDPQKVCLDNACVLGKWLYGDGAVHSSAHSYSGLRDAHATFHKIAGSIVEHIDKGDQQFVKKIMASGGEYSIATEKCVSLIKELENEVQSSSSKKAA